MFGGNDSWPGPHFPALRTTAGDAPTPPARPGNHGRVAGEPGEPRPRRRPLGAAPARARREGSVRGPGRGPAPSQPPEKMEAAPGTVTGRGRAGGSRASVRAPSRAGPGGHSRGWAGRLPLRLRVVAVPVLGRLRRLGLLARSPRRGSGARPLRCLLPAPAPGNELPWRRLRGLTTAQGLPRRPPHCCARSSGLQRLLLRAPAPPLPSPAPGTRRFGVSQAAPLPVPGPSPALTCALRRRRGRDVGRRRNAPFRLGRPLAAGRTRRRSPC